MDQHLAISTTGAWIPFMVLSLFFMTVSLESPCFLMPRSRDSSVALGCPAVFHDGKGVST